MVHGAPLLDVRDATQGALSPICSFGIVIWEILTQKKPYSGSTRQRHCQLGSRKGLGGWGFVGAGAGGRFFLGTILLFKGSPPLTLLPSSPYFLELT